MSTPTVALYYDDYKREMDAEIRAITSAGVVLDRTVFYPRGGNQDGDHGTLRAVAQPDAAVPVAEVVKDAAGVITHLLAAAPAGWSAGTLVHGALDWDRRETLMRLHTAQHLISRWFLNAGNATARVDIAQQGCVIELEHPVTVAQALRCQGELNALIGAGRPVQRIDTDGYLEIEVHDYDRQPCGGTHVRNIQEIGRIAFTRVKNNRLEMCCGPAALAVQHQMAEAVLALLGDLETTAAGFRPAVENVLSELRTARASLHTLREEVAVARIAGAVGDPRVAQSATGETVAIFAVDLAMAESKAVPRLLKPVLAPGRVFLCLCAGRNLTVISGSPVLPAGALVARLRTRYGINGGGSPAFAQCGPLPTETTLGTVAAACVAAITGAGD